MRVLVVGDAQSPHTRRWATALAEYGASVVIAGFGGPPLEGIEIVDLGRGSGRSRYAFAIGALRRALQTVEPDLVNAHFVSSYGVMTQLARPQVPVVMTAWGSDVLWLPRRQPLHRAATVAALRRAALVTFDSDDVGAILAQVAPSTPRRRVVFGPERSWLVDARHEEPVVLSVRRPEDFYNIPSIIEAFARQADGHPEWQLEILTYGLQVPELRGQVADLRLEGRVRFLPVLDRAQLRTTLLRAAIFCSVPSSDATAASLLEGMAAGSFPIVSDLAANREWITPNVNGLVVPPGDADSLTSALGEAMDDPGRRGEAGRANRARIERDATWETIMYDLFETFESLSAARTSTASAPV